jgi:L-lactate dehydrogenase (cytochrome)
MRPFLNVEEARQRARHRLPRGLFEYIDRGSEDEVSLRENRRALDAVRLVPRTLVDVSTRNVETTVLGRTQASPIIVAPTALAGLVWHDGEIELAKAAAAAGIPFCVSTQSITSVERIAAESGARIWFQLYMWKSRERTLALIERAHRAGAEALVLTVDTAVTPKREYNIRNGFGIPIKPSLRAGIDALMHPLWFKNVFLKYLRDTGIPTYAHYPDEFRTQLGRQALASEISLATDISWEDVHTLRRHWKGHLILKGILSLNDARRAADYGADGIVVSNHGARNLDCAIGPTEVLPMIADSVGHRLAVLADSGVRRGSDIARFMALGAQAVLVGRSLLYGVALGGMSGASAVLDVLRDELETAMGFLGTATVSELPQTLPAFATASPPKPSVAVHTARISGVD